MAQLPKPTLSLLRYLKGNGIDPILYGSQGVSLYLGAFKEFSDIDLLIGDRFLNGDWPQLVEVMEKRGFTLTNIKEHEFSDDNGASVAYASEQILLRDGIVDSLDQIETISIEGVEVRTLSRADFIKAYEFSRNDGYRKDVRGKNDDQIIAMLKSIK